MSSDSDNRLMELCRLASEEHDGNKLLDLVSEINRELDGQQNTGTDTLRASSTESAI